MNDQTTEGMEALDGVATSHSATPLPSKDSVTPPKKEVLELQPEDKPEPVSTVVPEFVIPGTVLQILDCFKSHLKGSKFINLNLDHNDVEHLSEHIKAAYQRIADLESQAKETSEWSGKWGRICARQSNELTQLKSQIAAMKRAGDKIKDAYVRVDSCDMDLIAAWKGVI